MTQRNSNKIKFYKIKKIYLIHNMMNREKYNKKQKILNRKSNN